ncbi:MAG TPA: hypothetical protein VJZ00_23240 [Thermoanaerobaculia bacterium]|nr:hypothetical protein [Thermoanaerobaculia bacterium]
MRLGADGASEMDRHRRVIFILREDILRLELSFCSGAERPVLLAFLGIVFAALAFACLVTFVLAIARGGVKIPASVITGVVFLIPAWWLLDLSIRKRWVVIVQTRTGTRKLVFHSTRDRAEIDRFLATSKARFGY